MANSTSKKRKKSANNAEIDSESTETPTAVDHDAQAVSLSTNPPDSQPQAPQKKRHRAPVVRAELSDVAGLPDSDHPGHVANSTGRKLSQRTSKGQGGALARMEGISNMIQAKNLSQQSRNAVISDASISPTLVNPMAPQKAPPARKRQSKQKTDDAAQMPIPEPATYHLVPPAMVAFPHPNADPRSRYGFHPMAPTATDVSIPGPAATGSASLQVPSYHYPGHMAPGLTPAATGSEAFQIHYPSHLAAGSSTAGIDLSMVHPALRGFDSQLLTANTDNSSRTIPHFNFPITDNSSSATATSLWSRMSAAHAASGAGNSNAETYGAGNPNAGASGAENLNAGTVQQITTTRLAQLKTAATRDDPEDSEEGDEEVGDGLDNMDDNGESSSSESGENSDANEGETEGVDSAAIGPGAQQTQTHFNDFTINGSRNEFDKHSESDLRKDHPVQDNEGNYSQSRVRSPILVQNFDISPDEDERTAELALAKPYKANLQRKKKDKTGHPTMRLADEHISSDEMMAPLNYTQALSREPPELASTAGTHSRQSFNVLKEHHKKNRAPRPPSVEKLAAVRAASASTTGSNTRGNLSVPPSVPESSDSENSTRDDSKQLRVKRYSRTPYTGSSSKPTQLNFYPGQWKDILELAKRKYRLQLATQNAFPDREKDFKETGDCLTEAMQEHADGGGQVEEGIFDAYESDMKTLIWQEGSTFRGAIKTAAHGLIHTYSFLPPAGHGLSDVAYKDYIKKKIAELTNESMFLRNGRDEYDRTNNFAHPALQQLCQQFFYRGSNSLGNLYPEYFEDALPRAALVLAASAIKCALDDWKTGSYHGVKFTADKYTKIYKGFWELVRTTEADAYHGRKLEQSRKQWATHGRVQSGSREETSPSALGLGVCLD